MLRAFGITGLPVISSGDDIGAMIAGRVRAMGVHVETGDVVVVAQAIVSKSEGCVVDLSRVKPTEDARHYARITGKEPRLVQVVLDESKAVLGAYRGFILCETRHGFVCANAGVDQSNVGSGRVTTLPPDPDGSARRISESLESIFGHPVPVLICDSEGRPFRRGAIGVAVGVHGMDPVESMAGRRDLTGRELETTEVCVADMLCSSAALVMGEADEGIPAVVLRGFEPKGTGSSSDLLYERDVMKERIMGGEMLDHPDN